MIVAIQNIETPEQQTIRLKNLEHVRELRGLVTQERSLARSAFERLSHNQKRYLLIASGIDPAFTDWHRLTDNQVKAISIGIKRLKIIVNEFVNCSTQDFSKSNVNII